MSSAVMCFRQVSLRGYLAGIYAMAGQADPTITPQEFWASALQTGKTSLVEQAGKQVPFGVILDPHALMAALHK